MEIVWKDLSAHDARAHDELVQTAAMGHYSQTRAWADVATRGQPYGARLFLAKESARVVGAALVLRVQVGPLALPLAFVERGPVARPEDFDRVLAALCTQCKRRGILRLSVMPYATRDTDIEPRLLAQGFAPDQKLSGTHAATLRLSINGKSDDEIFSGSERKKLRYEITHAERAGVTVRLGDPRSDMGILRDLDTALMATQHKRVRSGAWFEAMSDYLERDARGALFVAEHDNAPLSAVLVIAHGLRTTYVAGASTPAPRPFSRMALPLAHAIRWARDRGCHEFDFGGIPLNGDSDAKRRRIAQFKLDFTHTRVELVRRHTRWL